jgi:hypothetical protein
MHRDDVGLRRRQHDRREILQRMEARLLVQADVDREDAVVAEQHRVAVGIALRDDLGGDVAPGAGAVVDHDRLAEALRELRRERARHRVARASRGESQDQPDRPHGILLRRR